MRKERTVAESLSNRSAPWHARATPVRQRVLSVALTCAVWGAAAIILGAVAAIIGDIVYNGLSRISWEFLTTASIKSGRSGGIAPVLVSTLIVLAICMAVVVPIGIGTSLLLSEFTSPRQPLGRAVRFCLDMLAAMPSIVFGLFGNAFFCITLGFGYSLLSGGLTLACMVLPFFISAAEQGLRNVPGDYRLGAAGLGLSKAAAIRHVLLPAAAPALVVGLVLAIGRALAETAALLFTSGYVDRMPSSVFDSGRVLSIHIFELAMNVPGGNGPAQASTLVLVLLLLVINGAAYLLADRLLFRKLLVA
jgi:phosphate transport system permease protein